MMKGVVKMMDDLDRSLIALLSSDARLSLATMARRLKIARSTLQARLERLETAKIIAGYTIKLGEGAREQRLRATVLVSIEPRSQPNIITRLRAISEIERVITTSGRFDLMLQIACPSTGVLDRVLDQIIAITGIIQTESLIHLSNKLDRAI
jgi:DNA-binding Lrp family transcriptional regulator|tara:strand:+ start:133 stop:588 length:456 start_codon:yes stop_codon:yes gene_type:complete